MPKHSVIASAYPTAIACAYVCVGREDSVKHASMTPCIVPVPAYHRSCYEKYHMRCYCLQALMIGSYKFGHFTHAQHSWCDKQAVKAKAVIHVVL